MSFQKRKQWEGMFEDGVVVEGIDIGEAFSVLLKEDKDKNISAASALPARKEVKKSFFDVDNFVF